MSSGNCDLLDDNSLLWLTTKSLSTSALFPEASNGLAPVSDPAAQISPKTMQGSNAVAPGGFLLWHVKIGVQTGLTNKPFPWSSPGYQSARPTGKRGGRAS